MDQEEICTTIDIRKKIGKSFFFFKKNLSDFDFWLNCDGWTTGSERLQSSQPCGVQGVVPAKNGPKKDNW